MQTEKGISTNCFPAAICIAEVFREDRAMRLWNPDLPSVGKMRSRTAILPLVQSQRRKMRIQGEEEAWVEGKVL